MPGPPRKTPPRKNVITGRPRAEEEPKKPITAYIRQSSLDWIAEHVPRGISLSAFVDQAVADKIGTEKTRKR